MIFCIAILPMIEIIKRVVQESRKRDARQPGGPLFIASAVRHVPPATGRVSYVTWAAPHVPALPSRCGPDRTERRQGARPEPRTI
ncbi:protein of unknown function [Bradyrhizobium vignae]|uniref:Uncharacterized protein n=1 Tax=Bradyrhizobium vignae TaxID=1549949 RepID=A0A2U3PVL2_9BRAD|nr:protein of unknown function [Bradyrhizobium vignae]